MTITIWRTYSTVPVLTTKTYFNSWQSKSVLVVAWNRISQLKSVSIAEIGCNSNKANLKDLIAATGLVILLKLASNRRFFSPCDLEIWWMTSKNYRAPLVHYIKLCASYQNPRWNQTGVTVWKRSIQVKIGDFFCPVWPWNLMDDLAKQQDTSSMLH